jgi:hypothetical protein
MTSTIEKFSGPQLHSIACALEDLAGCMEADAAALLEHEPTREQVEAVGMAAEFVTRSMAGSATALRTAAEICRLLGHGSDLLADDPNGAADFGLDMLRHAKDNPDLRVVK